MELVELLSPHVVMPVIGVVLCAFIVFAFGFRSPVQPPSFQFEEDKRNKKRLKPTKAKAPANGHVISEPPAQYAVAKASPSVKESKPAASPKAKQSEIKNTKKEGKQELKAERKEKMKKQSQSEEVAPKQKVAARKETEDDGEWTTVQVPKKSKKQKPTTATRLRDGSLPESAVESEPELEINPANEAAAAAASAVEPVVEDTTGPTQAAKLAKKKTKRDKAEKPKQDDKEEILTTQEVEKVVAEDKKKKKKEKKTSASNDGGAAAGAAAALPQEAAPASAKSVGKEAAGDLPPSSELIEEEIQPTKASPKKKKGKPKENTEEDTLAKVNDAQEKPEKKVSQPSKKNEKKRAEPKENEKVTPSTDSSSPILTKVAAPDVASEESKPSTNLAAEKTPTSPVSFDEIGDSWQEAAPKSKKKKPRRDN